MLRGICLPILIRFAEILKHRLGEIHGAFQTAIREHQYQGDYCCVYPIKVNQQRQVVEEVLEFGKPFKFGLEAGSKPELLAVMAMADNDTPIICNGFKDDEYIEMAMLAQKIGRQIIPVVEKYTELDLILKYAERVGVRPIDRHARQAGQPRLGALAVVGRLPLEVRPDRPPKSCARSQELKDAAAWTIASSCCTSIWAARSPTSARSRRAVNEAVRVYVELGARAAPACSIWTSAAAWASITTARRPISNRASTTRCRNTPTTSSITSRTCATKSDVPHPTIVSESGRAIVAYHSVLVFNVLGVSGMGEDDVPPELAGDAEQPLIDLQETYRSLTAQNLLESYHDAQQALDRR